MTEKPDPNFVAPWQDMPTLCRNICATPNTVDKWVKDGILPPPRKKGGKQMWKWAEVDEYLSGDGSKSLDPEAERIRNATRKAEAAHAGH